LNKTQATETERNCGSRKASDFGRRWSKSHEKWTEL